MKSAGLLTLSCLLVSALLLPAPAVAAATPGHRLEISPKTLAPEKAQTLTVRLRDGKGRAITKLAAKAPVRLFVVRSDAGSFEELALGEWKAGRATARWTPKSPGQYTAWVLFEREGKQTADASLRVRGEPGAPFEPEKDVEKSKTNGRELLVLRGDVTGAKSGGTKTFAFDVRQSGTGAAVTDFEQVSGARAHLFAVKVGAVDEAFVHARAFDPPDAHAHDDGANPYAGHVHQARFRPHAQSAGARLGFEVAFPEPGLYRVFIQYARQGRTEVQAFSIPVE